MSVVEINVDNISDFSNMIPTDFSTEISRTYIGGKAYIGSDNLPKAGVIWELKNSEDKKKPNKLEILWFYAEDADSGNELLRIVDNEARNKEVLEAYFEFKTLGSNEQNIMRENGYNIDNAESSVISVSYSDIESLPILQKEPNAYISPLSDIQSYQFKSGILSFTFRSRYGLLDDLPFLPISRYDPDLSCCALTDSKVDGFLLLHKIKTGLFRVELFSAMQPNAQKHLLNMMRFSAHALKNQETKDITVLLTRHDEASVQLISKMFPDKRGEEILKGHKKYVENRKKS